MRAPRSASNSFKAILPIKTKVHKVANMEINDALSRFTWPSLVLKRALAKETRGQEKRFRPQRSQHYQSNRNRNQKGEHGHMRQEHMVITYQSRFPADEAVAAPFSRRCGILNRAKHEKVKKVTPSKNNAGRHRVRVRLDHGSKRVLNGDQRGDDGCSFTSRDRGQRTFDPATVDAPRSRRPRSRVNGADIYVVRTTKKGLGNAKPCWRCLEWCRWAGVRRIFYWDASIDDGDDDEEQLSGGECPSDSASVDSTDAWEKPKGRWEVVKVNNCRVEDCYITSTDGRILCGEVSIEASVTVARVAGTSDLAVHRFDKYGSYMEVCYHHFKRVTLTLERAYNSPLCNTP